MMNDESMIILFLKMFEISATFVILENEYLRWKYSHPCCQKCKKKQIRQLVFFLILNVKYILKILI